MSDQKFPKWFVNIPVERLETVSPLMGRDEDLKKLCDKLSESLCCVLCGCGGIGKTTLVLKLIDSIKEQFHGVFWINGESAEFFCASVSKICDEITDVNFRELSYELRRKGYKIDGALHFGEKIEAVRDWISQRLVDMKFLIVVDDYNEAVCSTVLRSLLPEFCYNKQLKVIIATQRDNLLLPVSVNYKLSFLGPLPHNIVVSALKQVVEKRGLLIATSQEEDAAHKIGKIVDGLPLALDHVAAFLIKERMLLSQYREGFDEQHIAELQSNSKPTSSLVFQKTYQEVCKTPATRKMMDIACLCAQAPIPVELFSLGCEGLPGSHPLKHLTDSKLQYRSGSFFEMLNEMNQYHLVTSSSGLISFSSMSPSSSVGSFSVHSVVRSALQKHQTDNDRLENIKSLSIMLTTVLKRCPTDSWQLWDKMFTHVMECYRLTKRMSPQSHNRDFLLVAGKRLSLSGHFLESCQLLKTCLEEIHSCSKQSHNYDKEADVLHSLGSDYDKKADVLHSLGSAKRRLGQLGEATRYTQQACKLWRSFPETEHNLKKQARTDELYAEILMDVEMYQKAETLLDSTKVIVVERGDFAESSEVDLYEATSCLGNLARAYAGQHQYSKAAMEFRRAIDVLGKRDYFRYHLYEAQEVLNMSWEYLEACAHTEFKKSFRKCYKSLAEIKLCYSCKHRYYTFLCREIAKLALKASKKFASTLRKATQRPDVLTAMEMSVISLEGQLDVHKHKHHKVAKTAEVLAHSCLQYALLDKRMATACKIAAVKCLELALRIWADTVAHLPDEMVVAATKRCRNLRSLQESEMQSLGPLRISKSTEWLANDILHTISDILETINQT